MKARSPENGFDEIRDLFKDDEDESDLLDDLELSNIINKDLTSGYFFDDLIGYDTYSFQLNEQGQHELPSLPLSFEDYDLPGPSTYDPNPTVETGFQPDDDTKEQNLNSGLESVDLDRELLNAAMFDDDDLVVNKEICFEAIQKKVNDFELCFTEANESLTSQTDPDIPGPSTYDPNQTLEAGFRHDDYTQDHNLPSEPNEATEVVLEIVDLEHDHGALNVAMFDDDLVVDKKTCFEVIQEKANDFELCFTEANDDSISQTNVVFPHQVDQEEVRLTKDSKNEPKCAGFNENQNQDTPRLLDDQEYSASDPLVNVSCPDISLVPTHLQVQLFDHNIDTEIQKCSENVDVNRSASPSAGRSRKKSCNGEYLEKSQYQSRETSRITSRKRKCQVADNNSSAKELDGGSDLDRGFTLNSSCHNSTFYRKSHRNILESSCSKQSHVPPRHKHSHSKRSVSPLSIQAHERYNEYKRDGDRSRSRSRSPCGTDHHRTRRSSRQRYASRRHSSRHSRNSAPAFFRRTGLGKPGSCLFVAGFSFSITERELARRFSRFGQVRNVRIIRDKRSGKSRGYGFLSLERSEEADAAIRGIHRTIWNGRTILVEKSVK